MEGSSQFKIGEAEWIWIKELVWRIGVGCVVHGCQRLRFCACFCAGEEGGQQFCCANFVDLAGCPSWGEGNLAAPKSAQPDGVAAGGQQ